ncbi:MAG: uridine kinase [Verrucomicrobiota bacterium]
MDETSRKLIGIAGASGSGKSTLAEQWAAELGSDQVLCFDFYYHSIKDDENPDTKNFDHPDALDSSLFCQHLEALKSGQSIEIPSYDFKTHKRTGIESFNPDEAYVCVEGILLLHFPKVRELIDVSVFIDTPFDMCVKRRLKRDCEERGRSEKQAHSQIGFSVEPMYQKYVLPSRRYADHVIEGSDSVRYPISKFIL